MICVLVKHCPTLTQGGGRIACARLSRPHSPHPVGPAICRRRSPSAAPKGCFSHIRSSMPAAASMTSRLSIWLRDAITRSVRLKPSAKSRILRRRHHDRVGPAIVGERDGGLFRVDALAGRDAGCPIGRAGTCATAKATALLRGLDDPATRRLWRTSSPYSSCHALGPFEGET